MGQAYEQVCEYLAAVLKATDGAFAWPIVAIYGATSLLIAVTSANFGLYRGLQGYVTPLLRYPKTLLLDVAMAAIHLLALQALFDLIQRYVTAHTTQMFRAPVAGLADLLPWARFEAMPTWLALIVAAVVIAVAFDFGSYCSHRLVHSFDSLWILHRVHHSGRALSIFTNFRRHPFDHVIRVCIAAGTLGAALVVLDVVLWTQRAAVLAPAMTMAYIAYMMTGYFQHSHVPVVYPRWTRWVLLSPHLHLLHHSSDAGHQHRNYGGLFAFWDRMFGTYLDVDFVPANVPLGLGSDTALTHDSLWRAYFAPLAQVLRRQDAAD